MALANLRTAESTKAVEKPTLADICYVCGNDAKAVLIADLLGTNELSSGDLLKKSKTEFPELNESFYPHSSKIFGLLQVLSAQGRPLVSSSLREEEVRGRLRNIYCFRLTELGSKAVPFVRFGLHWAYLNEHSLTSILGYEQGGAPDMQKARSRVATIKLVAKNPGGISMYNLAAELGAPPFQALEHVVYLESTGVVELTGERSHSKVCAFKSTGNIPAEINYAALEGFVAIERFDYFVRKLEEISKSNQVVTTADLEPLASSRRTYFIMLKTLEENGIVERQTIGSRVVHPTGLAVKVMDELISPIERALAGDSVAMQQVKQAAEAHWNNRTVEVPAVAQLHLAFYKHLKV